MGAYSFSYFDFFIVIFQNKYIYIFIYRDKKLQFLKQTKTHKQYCECTIIIYMYKGSETT